MFRARISLADTFFPVGYLRRSRRARTTRPPRLVVFEMRFTTVSYERNGRPRQLIEMKEKSRCSTLFHLLVPGGKWLTWIAMPSLSDTRCSSYFQTCER